MPPIRAAFLVSEGFTRQVREQIEAAFRTRVFSFYGHSERLVLGGECELNETYHHFPDYGVLEIVTEDGRPCDREGERGEIVAAYRQKVGQELTISAEVVAEIPLTGRGKLKMLVSLL